ncbi:MAG TPA: hypothetical protein VL096_08130 [Pirellulaceae bacterium]|nr:hypothetical protein [Pirellulaceae bacterium]
MDTTQAEPPPVHHQYHLGANSPPGFIGQQQLQQGGPRAGYFQPVEIKAPDGAGISLVEEGRFGESQETRALVGLQIGYVYQLKITNIPLNDGVEIYPTIELFDRLYPPQGQETRFPIPIELTNEELDHAANGRYVTRVIYLEDPRLALGVRSEEDRQRYYEVDNTIDPLEVADRAGRPMAILRMGSRVPTDDDLAQGKVRLGPFVKFKFPAAAAQPRVVLPPVDKDVPKSDFHEHVPRTDPDARWSLVPTMFAPQMATPPRNVRR